MAFDFEMAWNNALSALRDEIGLTSYETWFGEVALKQFYNNCFYITVPNNLTREWIESRFKELMIKHLSQALGREVSVSLSVKARGESVAPTTLNARYTFETFVVGNSNRFAHAACIAVAEAPARAYNPLFIYGGVGLGKTHLMQAIGHHVLARNPEAHIVYVSSEQFTNEIINAIRDDRTQQFRNKYRNVDILLIDDIQFLAGKERTQEEFFHTFNALYEANKQLVISSDRPPREIPTLEDRLRSRFEWGLITDIQPPDLETRIAILRKKSQLENIEVPNDVMVYIAHNIKSNIRELEGALIRVVAFSNVTGQPVDLALASQALKDIMPPPETAPVNIDAIKKAVAEYFAIKTEDLTSKRRTQHVAFPRQIAMYLCRELTDASLPKIGSEFGGRDHTTALHAYDKIAKELEKDTNLLGIITEIKNRINQSLTAQ